MRVLSLIQGRCPHCLQGQIFHSLLGMHEQCPVCGIRYEREEGFFSMSIFLGYLVAAVPILAALGLASLFHPPSVWYYFGAACAALIFSTPWIFRYGRIWWLYIDEKLDPR